MSSSTDIRISALMAWQENHPKEAFSEGKVVSLRLTDQMRGALPVEDRIVFFGAPQNLTEKTFDLDAELTSTQKLYHDVFYDIHRYRGSEKSKSIAVSTFEMRGLEEEEGSKLADVLIKEAQVYLRKHPLDSVSFNLVRGNGTISRALQQKIRELNDFRITATNDKLDADILAIGVSTYFEALDRESIAARVFELSSQQFSPQARAEKAERQKAEVRRMREQLKLEEWEENLSKEVVNNIIGDVIDQIGKHERSALAMMKDLQTHLSALTLRVEEMQTKEGRVDVNLLKAEYTEPPVEERIEEESALQRPARPLAQKPPKSGLLTKESMVKPAESEEFGVLRPPAEEAEELEPSTEKERMAAAKKEKEVRKERVKKVRQAKKETEEALKKARETRAPEPPSGMKPKPIEEENEGL